MNRLRLSRSLRRTGDDGRRGAVAIQVAIMLVGLIGFASLGTEVVLMLATSRHMQSAADAGALASLTARIRGYPADYRQEAYALAADAGFVRNAPDGTTVTVNDPPASGSYTGDAVEVLIAQPQVLALARVVYSGPFVVRARAVAHISGNGSCVLTLDPAASGAFSMSGNTVADFLGCDLSVNSTSPQAVSLVGGAIVNADHLNDVGGYSLSGGAQINAATVTSAVAADNPYKLYLMPTAAATCTPDPNVKTTKSISAGTYCSITVSSANLTLAAGTYFIKGGTLAVKAGATLTGNAVTIVLTGAGANYGTVNISANSTVTLTAPVGGATAGLVFFQDRNAPTGGKNTFNGGTTQNITGALYFPKQEVDFGGGTSTTVTCIEIIALTVKMIGNATLKADCSGTGVLPIGGGSVVLAE